VDERVRRDRRYVLLEVPERVWHDHRRAYVSAVSWPLQGQAALVLGNGRPAASPGEQPVPIASLAKVMTAYLTLKRYPLSGSQGGFTITITATQAQAEAQVARAGGGHAHVARVVQELASRVGEQRDQDDAEQQASATRPVHGRSAPAGCCSCWLAVGHAPVKAASCCQNVCVF
jgi:hypothetical protein